MKTSGEAVTPQAIAENLVLRVLRSLWRERGGANGTGGRASQGERDGSEVQFLQQGYCPLPLDVLHEALSQ